MTIIERIVLKGQARKLPNPCRKCPTRAGKRNFRRDHLAQEGRKAGTDAPLGRQDAELAAPMTVGATRAPAIATEHLAQLVSSGRRRGSRLLARTASGASFQSNVRGVYTSAYRVA